MTALCAALAAVFAFAVLAQPGTIRVDYTNSGWSTR